MTWATFLDRFLACRHDCRSPTCVGKLRRHAVARKVNRQRLEQRVETPGSLARCEMSEHFSHAVIQLVTCHWQDKGSETLNPQDNECIGLGC